MTTAPEALQLRGICKSFPGVRALDDVDFSVAAGEVHGLVGENGAGKSTSSKSSRASIGATPARCWSTVTRAAT